ncbi:MAG: CoA transferase [Alphaproteobacteria bacterium]|nr:CoA transferase [Alphaproteobacteria bacterium]MDE2012001.1 CoA transferase [Alphaproteobacteria bacterium]MDE2075113.1 CoA transferase [Alphaproteobacteria bacterium]
MTAKTGIAGPLSGVTVLDLTEFIFGPYATQTLGDLGAEIIKIENPGGDRQRHSGKHAKRQDMGSLYMALNRNKRSLMLDLKDEADREKLRALVSSAQVFIHNVRASAMDRLGFGYDEVAKLNPSIVYAHCVGYGSDGPYAGRQAFDDLVQSAAGAADLLPRVDGNPDMRLLPSFVADKVSSLHAVYAVLAALFHRERTGEGQFVEVPMFESFTHFNLVEHLYGESFVPPQGRMGHTPALANDRRPLATKNGHIAIQPVSREASAKFLELGGIPNAYESERFTGAPKGARVAVYYEMLREAAATRTTAEWMELGQQHHIPIMRANTLEEVLVDPHLKAVNFFQLRTHPSEGMWRAMRPPVKFSKTPASIRRDPPLPGQDNGDFE